MSRPQRDRVDVLAARVHWLDRYRRGLAVLVALIVFGLLAYQLSDELGESWVGVVTTLVSTLCAALTWWLVEVGLAWLTALWETEHHRLTRDRGLPRAQLVRRRK